MNCRIWILIGVVLCFPLLTDCRDFIEESTLQDRDSTSLIRTIPFHLVKKLIVVKAYVNGVEGNFIVDTGTDRLILNSEYYKRINTSSAFAADYAGAKVVYGENVVLFSWDNKEEQSYLAVVTPLSAIEKLLGAPIMGYIGIAVLEDYEILVDYQKREIGLVELDKKDMPLIALGRDMEKFDLKPNGKLPYLIFQIGGQKLKFGIDTGATINLLRLKSIKKIDPYFQETGSDTVAGFSGVASVVQSGILEGIKSDMLAWQPMDCAVSDMNVLNRTLPINLDGVFGFEFLKQYKVAINYKLNEIHFWHHESPPSATITNW